MFRIEDTAKNPGGVFRGWLKFWFALAVGFAGSAPVFAEPPIVVSSAPGERLPKKTDVSANFTSILCPSNDAAIKMLRDHIVPGDVDYLHGMVNGLPIPGGIVFDLGLFQQGLQQTNCYLVQKPIRINWALERKVLEPSSSRYLAFNGFSKLANDVDKRETIFGIIQETLNDVAPRSMFERWQLFNAPLGHFNRHEGTVKDAFVCPSSHYAANLVALRKQIARQPENTALKKQADALLAGCRSAVGRWLPLKLLAYADTELGSTLMALQVRSEAGKIVGLLHMAHSLADEVAK